MNTKHFLLSAAMLACFAITASASDETQAVEEAANKFYTSLNQLFTGDATGMQDVWSHADDVTYMGPAGGFLVGWDQVRDNWEQQASLKLGGKIEPRDSHITVGDNLAVFQCYEGGDNVTPEGKPIKVSIRATSVFRKENGEWKMIGHQTDIIPFLEKQQTLTKSYE